MRANAHRFVQLKLVALILLAVVGVGIVALTLDARVLYAASKGNLAPARGDDLILITIDTLRADALGFAGNKIVSTPNLDRLARQGRVFTFAHSQNVVTLPSHTDILTGLYPFQHGVRDNFGFVLPPSVPTMATILHAAGYATGAFVSAFPLDSRFGLNRGFDVYDDHYRRGSAPAELVLPRRRGDKTVALAMAWWKAHSAHERFLWVHLYGPHAPYNPPAPFKKKYAGHLYLGEVAATDHFLGPLLKPFLAGKERPAVIVVTGDHGESLGEHGEEMHGLFAYEATLHVPLVLWGPGVPKGTDGRLARHIDILPTVLALLGVAPPPHLPGRSLLAPLPKRPLFSYFEALTANLNRGWAPLYGILQGHTKYIDLPIPELYNLTKDPHELHNIIKSDLVLAARLKKEIPAAAFQIPRRNGVASADTMAKLRSLGYLSGDQAQESKTYSRADDPKMLVGVDREIHQMVGYFTSDHFAEAIKVGRKVIDARPEMAEGYDVVALALRRMNRDTEAIDLLNKAVKRGVRSEHIYLVLAQALNAMGRTAQALKVLEPYKTRGTIETRIAYATTLSNSGRNEDARQELEKIRKLDPNNPEVYENLGIVLLRLHRVSEAGEALRHALSLNPDLPTSLNTLGVVSFRMGNPEGALEYWQKSIELDPTQYQALFNFGMVAERLGQREKAKRALEQFIRTAPPDRFARAIRTAREALAKSQH